MKIFLLFSCCCWWCCCSRRPHTQHTNCSVCLSCRFENNPVDCANLGEKVCAWVGRMMPVYCADYLLCLAWGILDFLAGNYCGAWLCMAEGMLRDGSGRNFHLYWGCEALFALKDRKICSWESSVRGHLTVHWNFSVFLWAVKPFLLPMPSKLGHFWLFHATATHFAVLVALWQHFRFCRRNSNCLWSKFCLPILIWCSWLLKVWNFTLTGTVLFSKSQKGIHILGNLVGFAIGAGRLFLTFQFSLENSIFCSSMFWSHFTLEMFLLSSGLNRPFHCLPESSPISYFAPQELSVTNLFAIWLSKRNFILYLASYRLFCVL